MVGGATLIVLALMNLAMYALLDEKTPRANSGVFDRIVAPESAAGVAILQRVFGTSDPQTALRRVRSAPNFEMHPGLHYMTARISNADYRVGVEGIRYDAGWDDDTVRGLLRSPRPKVFLLGGSTMLGHGVSGDETISWHLNQRPSSQRSTVAFNFGAQAHDQSREIEKLLYLLRSGYRPRHVVLLDGWNDIVGIARSNMRREDRVVFHGFSINRGEVAFTPGNRLSAVNHLRLFAESLPVMRWLRQRERQAYNLARVTRERDAFTQGFDFREADWVFNNWERYAAEHREALETDLVESYRRNLEFLRILADGFGFTTTVLLQPMGLFDAKNAFVPDAARNTFSYRFLLGVRERLRREIARGTLPMVDLSEALTGIEDDRYVVKNVSSVFPIVQSTDTRDCNRFRLESPIRHIHLMRSQLRH